MKSFQNMTNFFERIKTLSFWQRLFSWGSIKSLSFDAYSDFNEVKAELEKLSQENNQMSHELKALEKGETFNQDKIKEINLKNDSLDKKIEELRNTLTAKEKKISAFEQKDQEKIDRYEEKIAQLNQAHKDLQGEKERRIKEKEEEHKLEAQRLKETWSRHEIEVEGIIKGISQRHNIEYIDKEKIPFKGKPDNTVKICDEYIIFDAKSPQGDDLSNFNTYIKGQAELVQKYAKLESVKNDIFLVVPTNSIEVIKERSFSMADYRVYIITADALEPLLLNLQKIETYEFAEKLSPEDREAIFTLIGKMAHGIKRRIQVDQYFSKEFLSVLMSADNLPEDIFEGAKKVERSHKLNPPQEKRAKEIPIKDLEQTAKELQGEVHTKGINTNKDLEKVAEIPLYTTDN